MEEEAKRGVGWREGVSAAEAAKRERSEREKQRRVYKSSEITVK